MSEQTASALCKREYETLSEFRYRLRQFLRFSEEAAHGLGITHLQYQLLLQVAGFPGRDWATVGELAERLQIHHHGAVALISRCGKAGLVERQTGRRGGRAVEVHLTGRGREVVARLAGLHRDELLRLQGIFHVPGFAELANAPERGIAGTPTTGK